MGAGVVTKLRCPRTWARLPRASSIAGSGSRIADQGRLHILEVALEDGNAKIPRLRIDDDRAPAAWRSTVHPRSHNSQSCRADNPCVSGRFFRLRRALRDLSKTRCCVDENCGPNRAAHRSESHATRDSHPSVRSRHKAAANPDAHWTMRPVQAALPFWNPSRYFEWRTGESKSACERKCGAVIGREKPIAAPTRDGPKHLPPPPLRRCSAKNRAGWRRANLPFALRRTEE